MALSASRGTNTAWPHREPPHSCAHSHVHLTQLRLIKTFLKAKITLGTVVHTFNPSTQDTETEGSLSSRAPMATLLDLVSKLNK